MSDGVLDWFWGIIEGDFNEDPSAGQIIIGIIIGFIPIVGTIADIRDVCANLRQISKDKTNTLAWIALVATIIAFIPGAGDIVKGVFKAVLGFIKKGSSEATNAIRGILAFLRGKGYGDPVRYLRTLKWDALKADTLNYFTSFTNGLLNGIEAVARNWLARRMFPKYVSELGLVQKEIRALQVLGQTKIPEAFTELRTAVDRLLARVEREIRTGHTDTNVHLPHSSKPLLRQEYELAVKRIDDDVVRMRKAGKSEAEIAEFATTRRRATGLDFKNRTDPGLRRLIYGRNQRIYRDELGPVYKRQADGSGWYYEKYNEKSRQYERVPRSDAQVIESSTQAGGDDLPWDKILEYDDSVRSGSRVRQEQLLAVIENLMVLNGKLKAAKRSGDTALARSIETEIDRLKGK